MKAKDLRLSLISVGLVLLLVMALQLGCDGSSGPLIPFDDSTYRLEGVMVKEPNRNVAAAVMNFTRNDSTVLGATVTVDADTLLFDSLNYVDSLGAPVGVYALSLGPADSLLIGAVDVTVQDSSRFAGTLMADVQGNLMISSVTPPVKGPADVVRVSWTGSSDAEGYVIAAVKSDSIFQGLGFSQYVTSGATSATFYEDAFLRTTLQGAEPNPGIYYLYVYAYRGVPDSALSHTWLPVPLPGQLDDNISVDDMDGRLGTVVVSYFGTVEVVASN